jgi:hypothetical protein
MVVNVDFFASGINFHPQTPPYDAQPAATLSESGESLTVLAVT